MEEGTRYALLLDHKSHKAFYRDRGNPRVVTFWVERVHGDEVSSADFKTDAGNLGDWVASIYGADKRVIRFGNLGDALKAGQFRLVKKPSYYIDEEGKIMKRLGVTEDIGGLPVDNSGFRRDREYVSVVPIDEGEFVYREIGQEVRFGRPIATFARIRKKVVVVGNYDIERMKQTLEDTIQRDDHWLLESLH